MKKVFLMIVALLLWTSLSYAEEGTLHVFDYKTGKAVTADTTTIGVVLTVKSSTSLPLNDPSLSADWSLNNQDYGLYGVTRSGITIFSAYSTTKGGAGGLMMPQTNPTSGTLAPNPVGSVSLFVGTYSLPQRWGPYALFNLGYQIKTYSQSFGHYTASEVVVGN